MPIRWLALLVCGLLTLLGFTPRADAQARAPVTTSPAVPASGSPRPADIGQTRSVAGGGAITSLITLADAGFDNGFRFANLGGQREIFVPLPQGAEITPTELVLTIDDISAHEARRSLEILVNDRIVAALALDGRSMGRVIRLPLRPIKARHGFLKLGFSYSGAATQDRCIDVRYVGDSVTIHPESAITVEIPAAESLDVATTVALMPRDVAVVLPDRPLAPSDLAAALTVARSLAASGRRVSFHRGGATLTALAKGGEPRRWSRGIVIFGSIDEFAQQIDGANVTVAGPASGLGVITAVQLAGFPALLVSDVTTVRAGRLLGSRSLAATRGLTAASVGEIGGPKLPMDRVSFDQLGLALGQAAVFGRADLPVTINARALPPGTSMSRLLLDIMVAPDGAGEKAVVNVFVNERLLGSAVAANGEPTRLDLVLPQGLVGTTANIRVVVQRPSAQGDCRFEPQGYPAQILGSSSVVLARATAIQNFADLSSRWAIGVQVLLPAAASERPLSFLGLISNILHTLAPETAPITVQFLDAASAPAPIGPFLAVSDSTPEGAKPLVHFDRGRIAVLDRSGRTVLDLGGFSSGAVAQLVTAGEHPGIWIKSLSADGTLPNPAGLRIDRGDVAVFDDVGTSLAMSTERDTLVKISYPDQVSWATVAARFRPWIIGGLWVLGTVLFLLALTRMYRRGAKAERD